MKYVSKLNLIDTEIAIKYIKDLFEKELANALHLIRVSAPLFVIKESGLNDNLNGVEEPVSFQIKGVDGKIEIVHSLAKWKREALARYNITSHKGIYTDMNAIRKDETQDAIHSIYVDQWDYEAVIDKKERNLDTLFEVVRIIYNTMKLVEDKVNKKYPVFHKKLPEDITFISTYDLEDEYPELSRKEREHEVTKKYGAEFLYQIGWDLKDGKPHDGRAPDYDDWNLNGDIIVYNQVLDIPFELSSMGIRVDEESFAKQIYKRGKPELLETPFALELLHGKLPYIIGGGIGQSRLCMFYLEKAHIGEVQASIWTKEELEKAKENNIELL